jgi:hypothetical protein
MKKVIILQILISLTLMFITASLYAEDKIILLNGQISSLEQQKVQSESEKQTLVNQGEELSYKIEELKRQSGSGLGIIGRFKLSQNLRKAQNLSDKIQNLDKKLYDLDNQIKEKNILLGKECESQVNYLIQKLNKTESVEEKKALLEKIKEYQSVGNQIKKSEQQKLEPLDITKIEIKEHDSPKEIREKADLINDIANKANTRISFLDSRISKLKDELKTRKKLDEFAEEISFFGERVAREEVASKSATEPIVATKTTDTEIQTDTLIRSGSIKTLEDPTSTTQKPLQTGGVSVRTVMKSNGVSADFSEIPQSRLDEELKILEKQKQELRKELATLTDKANSFRKKANELEKTGTKTGENQGTKLKKQSANDKSQGAKGKP